MSHLLQSSLLCLNTLFSCNFINTLPLIQCVPLSRDIGHLQGRNSSKINTLMDGYGFIHLQVWVLSGYATNGFKGESCECSGLLVDMPVFTQSPPLAPPHPLPPMSKLRMPVVSDNDTAEIMFFTHGIAVFFGFDEIQEHNILKDVHGAGTIKGACIKSEWKVRECHFAIC